MQSSTQIIESASDKKHYVVFHLQSNNLLNIEHLSNATQTKDALYINFKMMQSLEANKFKQNKKLLVSFNSLIENYLKTKNKIDIKTMPDELGKGAFGKSAFANSAIKAGEYVICAGVLEYSDNLPADASTINVSREFYSSNELLYNASYNDTLAKYFHHLPSDSMEVYNGETYATAANFIPNTVFAYIKLSGKKYSIPIVILRATRDVMAGEIIGFDFGFSYWRDRGLPFLFLSASGKTLTTYWLEAFDKKDRKFSLLPLSIGNFLLLVCHSSVQLPQTYCILPIESRTRLDSICQSITSECGSRVISLPTIVSLQPTHFTIIDKKVFINLDPKKPFKLGDNKLAKHFEIIHDILRSENSTDTLSILWIPLHTLVNSSTEKLINLRSFLLGKKIISAESFEINVNPTLLAEIANGVPPAPVKKIELHRHKLNSLFGKNCKGPAMPAPVVEKIIELERCLYGVRRK